MNLEEGKTYLINHSRKGTFMLNVTRQFDDWTEGFIVAGKVNAVLDSNAREKGESITMRSSFIQSAVEQL